MLKLTLQLDLTVRSEGPVGIGTAVDQGLDVAVSFSRTVRILLDVFFKPFLKLFGRHSFRKESPVGSLLAAEPLAGHEELGCPHMSHRPGDQPGSSAVRNIADVYECKSALGVRSRDLKIAAESQRHPGTSYGALDAGDGGFLNVPEPQVHFAAQTAIVRTQKMMSIYADVIVEDGVSDYGREVMLTPAPLYHAAGLCCVVKMARLAGTLVLEDCFCPDQICRQIEKYSATQIALVPPRSYQRLKTSNETAKCDFSSIRLAHITANHASRECMEDILTIFPNASLRLTWGSTEAANVTMSILTREQLYSNEKLFNTVGRVNSVSEIRLLGENGHEVADGDVGEAWVRSPLVFKGYINNPAKNAECFRGDWFDTEDLMYRDNDGFYYMVGRKRDMIKTGGENVYAQEVEQVIRSHPAVSDCAVVAVPDAKYDEAVGAAVVLKPGCSLDGHELIEYCKKFLPSYKKPKYLAIMDKLPENNIGKVQKNVLSRDYRERFVRISD